MTTTSGARQQRPPVIGRALLEVAQRLRRSRALDVLREIERTPFASPAEVRADQFRRLSSLLAHAEAHVPYYREMFARLGITSRDIRNLDDFSRLPILTKDIIRERWRDLVREDRPLESFLKHHSGGSTGVPLTFYRAKEYMEASDAGTFRNLMQSGWTPGEMVAFFWGFNDDLNRMSPREFEVRQTLRRMYQFDSFRSGADDMDGWLEKWSRIRSSVALGYASTVARFAAHVESRGARMPPLKGVFTTAEKLYPQQRDVIARVFGCHVFDLYGSSEVQNIAAECPRGRMHVNADFVVLETDDNAASAENAAGGSRPFLVTSLWNYTMPFIRYRNEDCGSLIEASCDCGNNFPLMNLDIARTSDNFRFANGSVIHGEFFTHLMYGSRGVANFQFHQTAPDAVTLLVVPTEGEAAERAQAISKSVAEIKKLAPEVRVTVSEVVAIPLSSAGKHRFTRSDVRGAEDGEG